MIIDVPFAGIEPWDALKADPVLWHIGFHQTPSIAEEIRKLGCANVTVEIINNSAHFVADEQPVQVTALIERYAAK